MSAYEISPKAAEVIYAALRLYAEHFDTRGTVPPMPVTLQNLLEVFAPPQPPTAAELAEALLDVASGSTGPKTMEHVRALARRWNAAQ
jgi:hypothetical protein